MVVPAVVLLPLAAVPVEAPLLPMPPPPPIMLPPPRPKFDPVWASTGSDVPASTAVIRAKLKHLPRIAIALVNTSSASLENARHPVPRPSRTEGRAAPRGFTICGIPAAIPAAAWRPACRAAVSRPPWPALFFGGSRKQKSRKNQPPAHTGRHFLQIPGPTNVPDRVLHAIAFPTIDHRGPEFADLGKEIVAGMRRGFQTQGTVVVYPSSGTGAWEAALVNTLSPGDRVLMFETGHFATLWRQMATRLGLDIAVVPGGLGGGGAPGERPG